MRTWLAAAGVSAIIAVAASCSGGSSTKSAVAGSGKALVTTTSSSSVPPTTAPDASTTVDTRSTSTPPASSPEGYAKALYDAWTKGDRAAAAKLAQPEAVDALFARQWQASDGWAFVDCSGAAGSVVCTWERSAGQLLLRVQNVTGGVPVTVSDVKFEP